jgi:hypothetical protein
MMTARWPCIVIAVSFLLAVTVSASAGEPNGFLNSPWGSSQATVTKSLPTPVRCHRGTEATTLICKNYNVGDVPITDLVLFFAPNGTLSGYTMLLPHDSYEKLRAAIVDNLGPPGHSSPGLGETVAWEWPSGTAAGLQEQCYSFSVSCFGVWTKALLEWSTMDEKGRKQQRTKGF